ncbi:Gfo/Idh/MocA family protein [Leifsonia poae]|uniref:Gfo/Idh/MocA family protein n=1 Tax=Leifsonia poae TaxID=110933 RepID=UPI003D668AD7
MTRLEGGAVPRSVRALDVPRVAVVGVHGYGTAHILNALELQDRGLLRLVALVDPEPGPLVRDGVHLPEERLPVRLRSMDELLGRIPVDIVVVATPLQTHAALAIAALRAGADVLLEKPPVTELASLARLEAAVAETGGMVQVGFQSLGSLALAELQRELRVGALGTPLAIGATGSWTRSHGYWTRSRWAGRRHLDGQRVADGAVANPFAHAVMTSLRIAGWESPGAIGEIETDLRRVNPIEADDTSAIRIRPSALGAVTFDGTLTCAFTLAGPHESEPVIIVRGTEGDAALSYTSDRLTIGGRERRFGRTDLLENLVAARRAEAELLSPLSAAGGFVRVIEAVTDAPVAPVDVSHVVWEGHGSARRPVLDGVESAVRRAVEAEALFSELSDVAWR